MHCVNDPTLNLVLFVCVQDAMIALNSELQLSQGTIGDLKTSVKEVRDSVSPSPHLVHPQLFH